MYYNSIIRYRVILNNISMSFYSQKDDVKLREYLMWLKNSKDINIINMLEKRGIHEIISYY